MKKSSIYIFLICLLFIPGACSIVDTDSSEQLYADYNNNNQTQVTDLSDVGCKKAVTKSTADETIFLKSLGGNKLQVRHCDIYYNCAAEIEVTAFINKKNVYIVEKESSTAANCTCPYDFKFNIKIGYGAYSLYINGKYAGDFTFNEATDTSLKMYK